MNIPSDLPSSFDYCECGKAKFKSRTKCTPCLEPERFRRRKDPVTELAREAMDVMNDHVERDRAMDRDAETDVWWVLCWFFGAVVIFVGVAAAILYLTYLWLFTF
jgi:hypothetical protein